MRSMLAGVCLVALLSAACGSSDCDRPAGCLTVTSAEGTCRCTAWETVRSETVPVKFVVVGVLYSGIGNDTRLSYGWTEGSGLMPPASSEFGGRFRAVVREPGGPEQVATVVNAEVNAAIPGPLHPVTPASANFLLAWGDESSGSAVGYDNSLDAPGLTDDTIVVWVNPTLEVTTNYVGERHAKWGWTSVGHCFWPLELSCESAHFAHLPVEVLAGVRSPGDVYMAQFLATLTPSERESMLRYHPLYDPPGRDPATLATDPRFLSLGSATVSEGAASAPSTTWTPCAGELSDDSFEVLHETEIPFAWSSDDVLIQHSVLSAEATCRDVEPGVALATSTPGCTMAATVYLDRMFGTMIFVPTEVAASCTRP